MNAFTACLLISLGYGIKLLNLLERALEQYYPVVFSSNGLAFTPAANCFLDNGDHIVYLLKAQK